MLQSDDDDGDPALGAAHAGAAAGPPRLHADSDRHNGFAVERRRSPSPERPSSFPLVDYDDDDEDDDGGAAAAGVPVRVRLVDSLH